MNTRTAQAFSALFEKVKDLAEVRKLYGALQDAVESEISGYAARTRMSYDDGLGSLYRSSEGRRVLERAWAADHRATEHDLIAAGARDVASQLGGWWLGEEARRRQRIEGARSRLDA